MMADASVSIDCIARFGFDTSVCACDKHKTPNVAVHQEFTMVFQKNSFSVFIGDKLLTDDKGLDKTPTFIAFHEKTPIIGRVAAQVFDKKPKFVVYDLIKLASFEKSDIIVKPRWGFSISTEGNNLIVMMETCDGKRKGDVPYLLALIIKSGSNRVKKELGFRVKNICVKFNGFVPTEILKKKFIAAGKLLSFVDQLKIV